MQLFETFFEIKEKKPLKRWKRPILLDDLEQAQEYEEYGGRLAPDTLLIDIDNKEQAECLLNIVEDLELLCQVRRTDRGMHFYFKNDGTFLKCGAHKKLAIGLEADIKVGVTNAYAKLKSHGVERKVIYDILPDEDYQTPPKWLTLLSDNCEISPWGMREGEGRNNDLFRYIIPLTKAGLSKEECRECVKLINDYVLLEPLGEKELESILRDEAFSGLLPDFYTSRGKFQFEVFANYLIKTCPIKRINGELHIYENGDYKSGSLRIENKMISIIPNLSNAQRQEVLRYINTTLIENERVTDASFIAFANGVLDIRTNEIMPFSPDIVIANRIPYAYNPSAYDATVDKTLNKLACGDASIRALLEELAGYMFFRRNELRKAFMLTGAGHNGKSTYISMLQTMIGRENYCVLDIPEISERFKSAELAGKLADLCDDISDRYIRDASVFKKLTSGESITAERKGQDPFTFTPYVKFVFSVNELPRFKDGTGAVLDRMIIIPFNASFSKTDSDYDPFIKDKLTSVSAMEYLIKLGIEGLKRVLGRNSFTDSEVVNEQLEQFNLENNPILSFYESISRDELLRESVGYWYDKYREFCLADGCTAMSRTKFTKTVCTKYGVKSKPKRVNGELLRFFV